LNTFLRSFANLTRSAQVQKALLETELEAVGIRLNKQPPAISYKVLLLIREAAADVVCPQPKAGGGLSINSVVTLSHLDDRLIRGILHEYSKSSTLLLSDFV
jgi:ribosome-interacting GTPase 1